MQRRVRDPTTGAAQLDVALGGTVVDAMAHVPQGIDSRRPVAGEQRAPDPRRGKTTRRAVTTIVVASGAICSGVPTEGGAGFPAEVSAGSFPIPRRRKPGGTAPSVRRQGVLT